MLQWGKAENRTVCALLLAIDEQEITLNEFAEAVGPLTSEALQVIATALRSCTVFEPRRQRQVQRAREICSQLAASSRVLS